MKSRLSVSLISKLRPKEKPYYVWDTQTAGFGLVVRPSGTKSFIVRKPDFFSSKKSLQITLGKLGDPLTLEVARKRARKARLLMDEGIDPRRHKKEAPVTVAEFADQYSKENDKRKKPNTVATEHSIIRWHIVPHIGAKPIRAVQSSDVRRMMNAIASEREPIVQPSKARGKSIVSGGISSANRTRSVLSQIFTHAIELDLRKDNPCANVKPFKEQKRERFLTESEIANLGAALDRAEETGVNAYAVAAIRVIALSGARKSEVLSLKWSYLDEERGLASLPDSKTGAKPLRLAPQVWSVLKQLPKRKGSDWVFPSLKNDGHLIGLQKIWTGIRKDAGLDDVRLHDLRHTFASIAVSAGHSLFIVGKALGHTRPSTTERYAHLAEVPVISAIDQTSETIAKRLKR